MTARSHMAFGARLLLKAAANLGVPETEVLKRSAVSPAAMDPGRLKVSWLAMRAIARTAIALTGEPALGLLAGLEVSVTDLGVCGTYMMHAPTLRESHRIGFEDLAPRATNIHGSCYEFSGNWAKIRTRILPPEDEWMEVAVHVIMGVQLVGIRKVFGEEAPIEQVSFRSTRVGNPGRLSALLRCPVVTGQEQDYIAIPATMPDRPMPLADPRIRDQLRPQHEAFLYALERDLYTMDAVRQVLETSLRKGYRASIESVAKPLELRPRSLRARLAAEGVTFTQLLDQVRMEESMRLLSVPGTKFVAVAMQLGFSDGAAFTRAFRRWAGMSPQAWRLLHPARGIDAMYSPAVTAHS